MGWKIKLQFLKKGALSSSVWAATAKHHGQGGQLGQGNLFIQVLEARTAKLKVPAALVRGDGPLPAHRRLPPAVSSQERGKEGGAFSVSSFRALMPL